MSDKESRFVITVEGDAAGLTSFLSGVKTQFKSAATDIERSTSGIVLFKDTEQRLGELSKALQDARARADGFRQSIAEIESTGAKAPKELTDALKATEKQIASTNKEYNRQSDQLAKLQTQLTAAGVNTRNLAAEEIRLAEALKVANVAQAEQQAKATLGIKTLADQRPELLKLQQAYQVLAASGKLSTGELVAAQSALRTKTAELKSETAGLGSALVGLRGPLLAAGAAALGVVAAVNSARQASEDFRESLTRISTVTNLTQEQLRELGEGIKKLAREMGFDLEAGLKAAFNLLSAGIPADNVLTILKASADASKASLTDLGTTAKLAALLINSLGLQAGDLAGVFDKIFAASKAGGATFNDLANSLGDLLPLAKESGASLDVLLAAFVAAKRDGLDTATAVAGLNKVLADLASPDFRKQLHAIGIETSDLDDLFRQLASKAQGLDQLREAFPDAKALRVLAAITNQVDAFNQALEGSGKAAGSIDAANAALDKLNSERIEKFTEALRQLKIAIGDTLPPLGKLLEPITALINGYTKIVPAITDAFTKTSAFGLLAAALPAQVQPLIAVLSGLAAGAKIAAQGQGSLNDALSKSKEAARSAANDLAQSVGAVVKAVTDQLAAVDKAIADVAGRLKSGVAALQVDASAAQAAASQAIANINARAAAEIAALDRSDAAQLASTQKQIAIERQAAADRFAVLQQLAANLLAAVNAAGEAQRAAALGNAAKLKEIDAQILVAKRDTLQKIVDGYTAHIAQLNALEQGHLQKLREIEDQRLALNQGVEDKIRGLRRATLTAEDQYADRVLQIDEKISAARQALFLGDTKAAEKFAQDAINLTDGIAGEVKDDQRTVISALDAQNIAIGRITQAQGIYNEALDVRAAKEREGALANKQALGEATEALKTLSTQLDAVATKAATGINAKISADVSDVEKALEQLRADQAKKEILLGVKIDADALQTIVKDLKEKIAAGVTDGISFDLAEVARRIEALGTEAPQLTLKTDDALSKVTALREAIDTATIAEINVKTNALEVKNELEELTRPLTTTLTIIRKVVDAGAGGDNAEPTVPPLGLSRGGQVSPFRIAPSPSLAQAFAMGGPVFSRPTSSKVPGIGNADTIPAALQAGSFVVRKSASAFYGDGAMRKLAQAFAVGGPVISLGDVGKRLLEPLASPLVKRPATALGNADPELGKVISAAFRLLTDIIGEAQSLPRSNTGQNIGDYLATVLQLIRNASSAEAAHALFDPIAASIENMRAAISQGLQFHVPVIMGAFGSGPSDRSGPSGLFDRLSNQLTSGRGGSPIFSRSFAVGGATGSDTVPAMLTPGEWVVSAPRVRQLGAGVMQAINSMAIPRASLATMLASGGLVAPRPPAHFAAGGEVLSQASSFTRAGGAVGTPEAGGRRPMTVNFNVDGTDLLSEEQIRRKIIPVLDAIARRGR